MAMAAERTINGSFGTLFVDGQWLANVESVSAKVTIEKHAIKIPGTRETGFKSLNTQGEGTISQFKITSQFLRTVSQYMRTNRSIQPVFTLRYVLDDPESFNPGTGEEIELTRVKFWEINIGYEDGVIVQEQIPFTFQNINIVQAIVPITAQGVNEYMNGGLDTGAGAPGLLP